ncbi:MAG: hypothetical protein CYPHOPRED_005783 [Cyphobasidiales sp. Tagirdzhanova-0007]|nr:MAG: hypothetical protein CYPHOPRED_005783 [Cyphobasidiales sp. Tagirdzhanova-0007]
MALNVAMLKPTQPPTPVPLPQEKFLLHVSGTQAELQAMSTSTALKPGSRPLLAQGTVYVTFQRIVFVADNAAALPATALAVNEELRSLSCNLSHFQDGRLVQPWLAANYYEGIVIPQTAGGLDGLHKLKIHFSEGRAFEFYQAVEEVKMRHAENQGRNSSSQEEALPLYTPAHQASASAANSGTLRAPSHEDLEAAACARAEETAEANIAMNAIDKNNNASDRGLPPSYEDAERS